MRPYRFLSTTALLIAILAMGCGPRAADAPTSTTRAADKPNIIFILCDDVGIGDMPCYGADHYKTPQIDSLAKSGMRYTNCYSMPLCGPSRATLMTGRYLFRTGMNGNQSGHNLKPENEIMIPKILEQAGYATAQVGKWNQLPREPSDWGFREYLRFQGSGKYWPTSTSSCLLNGERKKYPPTQYIPDAMHEFVVDFMTRHKDEPFFLYYSMAHVHAPIMRTPDSAAQSKDLYADNIAYMDKLVGKLLTELDRLHLRENTILVFVGDNGTAPRHARQATIGGRALSGMKGTLQEGGSRVPMIINWPGKTPTGMVNDALIDFSDFFPTFASLAHAKLPDGVTIDGQSFAGQITKQDAPRREWAYVELNGKWYVRSPGWKLNSAGELFDMKDAPFVEKPVPAESQTTEALAARKQLQAALDTLNPAAGKQATVPQRITEKLEKRETTPTVIAEKPPQADRKNRKAARRLKRKSADPSTR